LGEENQESAMYIIKTDVKAKKDIRIFPRGVGIRMGVSSLGRVGVRNHSGFHGKEFLSWAHLILARH
jgi:hypothetical protein